MKPKASQNSSGGWAARKSRWLVILSSGIFFLAAQVMADPAQGTVMAAPEDMQKMVYEVYAGGINAVTAEFDVAYETKDRYSLAFEAETKGFLGKVAPWSGSFETSGWLLDDGTKLPETHKSMAIWRGEEDMKEYKYNRDGSFESFIAVEAGKDVTPPELDTSLTEGTTDALTATLAVLQNISADGKCEGQSEVFDGKRRFEMIFRHEAEETLQPTAYNLYNGEAVRCTVEVKPVAGDWHEKPRGWMSIQEQGRDKGSMPTVWMAKIDEDGPAVPVKVRVKTNYGTLFMHLVSYQNEDGMKALLKK